MLGIFVGLLFAAYGCYSIYFDRHLARTGRRAAAQVVDLRSVKSGGDERGVVYYPVVVFRTADGQAVRAWTKYGAHPAPAQVGEQVMVIYDPAAPQNVMLARRRGRHVVIAVVMVIIGAALVGFQVIQMTR
jgi:hypothetical protein